MELELQIALIGILGTLGGTILGWFLNTLSQKGKLNIYILSWNDEFTYNNMGCMEPSSSVEQTQCYGYKLSLDLYNSSGEIKIMRNIKIQFTNGKSVLFQSIPKDDQTKRISSPMTYYDDISPVNIPAKSVININLHNGVWDKDDSLAFIWDVKAVYLVYTDKKNKNKKIMINKKSYDDYFSNHHIEE